MSGNTYPPVGSRGLRRIIIIREMLLQWTCQDFVTLTVRGLYLLHLNFFFHWSSCHFTTMSPSPNSTRSLQLLWLLFWFPPMMHHVSTPDPLQFFFSVWEFSENMRLEDSSHLSWNDFMCREIPFLSFKKKIHWPCFQRSFSSSQGVGAESSDSTLQQDYVNFDDSEIWLWRIWPAV